ncbi:RluA family pseudouridine synthase [Myxococcota bacterium]|nr:RluA family pseudouridine synthase [Myxococcota bacterium]
MSSLFTPFTPPPGVAPPAALPSPFDEGPPHPWALAAVEALSAEMTSGHAPAEGSRAEGKMWGVMVSRAADGSLFWSRAFSGQLGGAWTAPGCAPPLFDLAARAAVEGPGEARVKALTAEIDAAWLAARMPARREALSRLEAGQHAVMAVLMRQHEDRRALRAVARRDPGLTADARAALDRESAGDKAERKRLAASQHAARAPHVAELEAAEAGLVALQTARQAYCADLMRQLHDLYRIEDFTGAVYGLRALYAPAEPPTGAAECAAPKLLALAQAHGHRPVVLAEFFWGPPPPGGGRRHGHRYPACRGKCGPLLPAMLTGLDVAPPRTQATETPPGLDVVYEDAWLLVVDKPAGLLSVPGRGAHRQDSVSTRLAALRPEARGPLCVHRLDEDTSGLLLAAKDPETHAALQRLFETRAVTKTYVAVLERAPRAPTGTIELPLRLDPFDRPRQVVDHTHGRPARTRFARLEADPGAPCRVHLWPETGRTHQLRVHAAHAQGLDAPIVGDRLYGRAGGRLMLHAASLAFVHPRTGERVTFERPAPF